MWEWPGDESIIRSCIIIFIHTTICAHQLYDNYYAHCIHVHTDVHMHIPELTRTYTHAHTLLTYTCTCAVPSGHILTKEELQVLGAMLATHSDKPELKSIQLSLQEEQEIRDISREEVEKCLRQSGLVSMADALKDNIEKGIAWLPTAYTCTST